MHVWDGHGDDDQSRWLMGILWGFLTVTLANINRFSNNLFIYLSAQTHTVANSREQNCVNSTTERLK